MTSSADSRKGDYEQSFSSFKAAVNQTDKTVQLPRSYLGGYMAYICPGFPRSTWLTISNPTQLIPSHPFPIHYSDQPCHIHHSSIYSTCHVSRPVETNLYPCALFTVVWRKITSDTSFFSPLACSTVSFACRLDCRPYRGSISGTVRACSFRFCVYTGSGPTLPIKRQCREDLSPETKWLRR